MGIFGKILVKLGFKGSKKAEQAAQAVLPPMTQQAAKTAFFGTSPSVESPVQAPIGIVDVVAQLEKLAASQEQKLNWKVSIVDLLKLLGLDSSFGARKELAVELGCPPEKMCDSAQMNMWLHKAVLKKLADNGGNIPKDLLG